MTHYTSFTSGSYQTLVFTWKVLFQQGHNSRATL